MTTTSPQQVGELVSVNVGLPTDVSWRGRTVRTAVWKTPVAGPCRVRRLNLDGDGQGDTAGHGGEQRAVFVYQLDSYDYWQRELGRDDFEHGQFGENFTVRGLPDAEVCIGDRYGIGDAVFEVTQPRVTCYRVGIRLQDTRIPALLVSHHRPGFYLRVLTEGDVRAGDPIVKLATGPEAVTVAEMDALLYLPGHSPAQLRRALRIPALSPGWQASFRAMLAESELPGAATGNAGLTAPSPPPAWPGFRSLVVTALVTESTSVRSVHLADPQGAALPPALPGQFLTLRLHARPDGPPLLRSYSLSGPAAGGRYRISVKREPQGVGSRLVHSHLRVGDQVDVAAPRGSFLLRPPDGAVLLISAGVGATPVLAMLHALVADRFEQHVWWLHGARDGSEEPFAAESRTLLRQLTHGHRRVFYSRPGARDVLGSDYDVAGRLSAAAITELDPPREAVAYLCGPTAFMDEVSAALVAAGVDPSRIHTEVFGARPAQTPGIAAAPARSPHPPAGPPGTGPPVAFARSGLTVPWDPAHGNLLDLAEACDVPVRWSCRTGVCHSCESAVLSGTVEHDPPPVDPPADGSALICCATPRGELVLDL
ncbi:MAG: MOSC domain-containing protein [Actinomycetes bacterium]